MAAQQVFTVLGLTAKAQEIAQVLDKIKLTE
jgi:hypothetical protein